MVLCRGACTIPFLTGKRVGAYVQYTATREWGVCTWIRLHGIGIEDEAGQCVAAV